MRRQHCADLVEGRQMVDSSFCVLDPGDIWERRQAQYQGGRVNHYWPKSFEEFAIKKARGAALGGPDNSYDRPYHKFFEWNGGRDDARYQPMPPEMLAATHLEIARLKALEGVTVALEQIEAGFVRRLASIGTTAQLRAHYALNRVAAGPL
jgi:hypothetical protein